MPEKPLVIELKVTVDSGGTDLWIPRTPQRARHTMKSPLSRDNYLMGRDCPMDKKDFPGAALQNQS